MYWTPEGERVLLGAERRLFEEALGMIVDLLSDADFDFGVRAFDELQRGQKLFVLYHAGRALLAPDEPAPELTAYLEAAVAAIYRFMIAQVLQEIEEPEFAFHQPSWRRMVLDAFGDREGLAELPDVKSSDVSEWELLVECLEATVLWDDDFEMQVGMDADPDVSRSLKHTLGISDDYYVDVPCDVPDKQVNLYIDALKGLTPHGRGPGEA